MQHVSGLSNYDVYRLAVAGNGGLEFDLTSDHAASTLDESGRADAAKQAGVEVRDPGGRVHAERCVPAADIQVERGTVAGVDHAEHGALGSSAQGRGGIDLIGLAEIEDGPDPGSVRGGCDGEQDSDSRVPARMKHSAGK